MLVWDVPGNDKLRTDNGDFNLESVRIRRYSGGSRFRGARIYIGCITGLKVAADRSIFYRFTPDRIRDKVDLSSLDHICIFLIYANLRR